MCFNQYIHKVLLFDRLTQDTQETYLKLYLDIRKENLYVYSYIIEGMNSNYHIKEKHGERVTRLDTFLDACL